MNKFIIKLKAKFVDTALVRNMQKRTKMPTRPISLRGTGMSLVRTRRSRTMQ